MDELPSYIMPPPLPDVVPDETTISTVIASTILACVAAAAGSVIGTVLMSLPGFGPPYGTFLIGCSLIFALLRWNYNRIVRASTAAWALAVANKSRITSPTDPILLSLPAVDSVGTNRVLSNVMKVCGLLTAVPGVILWLLNI